MFRSAAITGILCFLLWLVAIVPHAAHAQTLVGVDPSFVLSPRGGKVTSLAFSAKPLNDSIRAIALQPDGKIVLAGHCGSGAGVKSDFCISRLTATGEFDKEFAALSPNGAGKLLLPIGSGNDFATSIALLSDGKILVAGFCSGALNVDFCAIKLDRNGSLDSTFARNGPLGPGKLILPIGTGDDFARSIVVQSDQKIVLSGNCSARGKENFCSARLETDGSLDLSYSQASTFGPGKFLAAISSGDDGVTASTLQLDGKLLLVGSCDGGANTDFCAVRLGVDGSIDTDFAASSVAGAGKLLLQVGAGSDNATAVHVQSDGKIVLTGTCTANGASGFCAARLNKVGEVDTGYAPGRAAGGGRLVFSMSTGDNLAVAAAMHSDGKVTIVGFCTNSTDADFCLARINTDGTLDQSFAPTSPIGASKLLLHMGAHSDFATSVAIQPDGNIVAAGFCAQNLIDADFCVARMNANGALGNNFAATRSMPIGNRSSVPRANVHQSDGHIVRGGFCDEGGTNGFCIVRLNQNGSLDESFASSSSYGVRKLILPIGLVTDRANTIATQTDGKIVLAGFCSNTEQNRKFSTSRLNIDRKPDQRFARSSLYWTGKQLPSLTYGNDAATAVAVQSVAKILVTGICAGEPNEDFCLVRLESDDSLDTSFVRSRNVSAGKLIIPIANENSAVTGMLLQANSKIFLAGSCYIVNDSEFCAIRFNSHGSIDGNFGFDSPAATGKLVIPFSVGQNEIANALDSQTNRRSLVAGGNQNWSNLRFCIARTSDDGVLGTGYSSASSSGAGKLILSARLLGDEGFLIPAQAEGKIVLVAACADGAYSDFCAACDDGKAELDDDFTSASGQRAGTLFINIGIGSASQAQTVALQSDGKTVVAALCTDRTNSDLCTVRLFGNPATAAQG